MSLKLSKKKLNEQEKDKNSVPLLNHFLQIIFNLYCFLSPESSFLKQKPTFL